MSEKSRIKWCIKCKSRKMFKIISIKHIKKGAIEKVKCRKCGWEDIFMRVN